MVEEEEDGRGRWKKGTNEEMGQEMREDVEREGRRGRWKIIRTGDEETNRRLTGDEEGIWN